MIFEGLLVKQRLNSLQMLRSMRRPAVDVLVYRNRQWDTVSSDELVPGDLISITSATASNMIKVAKKGIC